MCHVYEYTPWELKELLRSEGFEIIAMETWDPYTSDPRGLRNQIQKLFLLAGLILTFDWKKAALLYRNRGHQIGLLARAR